MNGITATHKRAAPCEEIQTYFLHATNNMSFCHTTDRQGGRSLAYPGECARQTNSELENDVLSF